MNTGPEAAAERQEECGRDPVCGTEIASKDPELSTEYAGVAYFFCSRACFERFLEDADIFTLGPIGEQVTYDRSQRPPSHSAELAGRITFEQSHT